MYFYLKYIKIGIKEEKMVGMPLTLFDMDNFGLCWMKRDKDKESMVLIKSRVKW